MRYFILLFFLLADVQAATFKDCSEEQQLVLTRAETLALEKSAKILEEIQTAATTAKQSGKLHHSFKVLACARRNMGKLTYKCLDGYRKFSAQVNWILASEVKFAEGYFANLSPLKQASALIHEHTHKCGTTDALYLKENESPRGTKFVPWTMIAETYDYWTEHGFCVPNETCP